MSAPSAERWGVERRMVVGAALAALLTIPVLAPVRIGDIAFPWPLAPLWAAFGWAWRGPSFLAAGLLLALGLWQDLLTGGPIGAWGLVYLSGYGALLALRAAAPLDTLPSPLLYAAPIIAAAAAGAWVSRMATGAVSGQLLLSLATTAVLAPLAVRAFLVSTAAAEDDA